MRIGVLGAGQLGRMLALAGIPQGIDFVFYDNDPHACAGGLGEFFCGDYTNRNKLSAFAGQVDLVTLEFENIPPYTLETLEKHVPVRPGPYALRVAQDRLSEKQLFVRLGIPAPVFHGIDDSEQLEQFANDFARPLMLKTRRFGYDGKGQARLASAHDAQRIWQAMNGVPLIAEELLDFDRELSLLAARGKNGEMRCYPLVENVHHNGILVSSRPVPGDPLQAVAQDYIRRVMEKLDYTGVLAMEFFDCAGTLVANEIAPRMHNSGHWTIEGAVTSQFENHLRAILGLPLGDTSLRNECIMYNLIGTMPERDAILAVPDAHLHDYGKSPRPGRKLGHVTLCNPDAVSMQRIESLLYVPVQARHAQAN